MNKQAELILRDAVEQILEHHNESYVITNTVNGFSVHFPDHSFVYFFSYRPAKGWLMDLFIENAHLSEVPGRSLLAYEKLCDVVDQCNIRYVLYKHKPKNRISQQKNEIDAFFSRYQELLRERKTGDTQLCYTFQSMDGLQPRITIEYNQENTCWIIHHTDFNKGETILPPLERIYHGSQRLIYELNKENM